MFTFTVAPFTRPQQRGLSAGGRGTQQIPALGFPSRDRDLTFIFAPVRFYLKIFSEAQKENTRKSIGIVDIINSRKVYNLSFDNFSEFKIFVFIR